MQAPIQKSRPYLRKKCVCAHMCTCKKAGYHVCPKSNEKTGFHRFTQRKISLS
jgi:hypothetical protein